MTSPQQITQLLIDWRSGDQSAFNKLMSLVYEELRRLAHHYMKAERVGHTLQTTALVNEAYLRLVAQQEIQCKSRAHFFAIAANVMRHLLVDHARSRQCAKHGGGARPVTLGETAVISKERSADLMALDEALTRLAAIDPRKSQIVELRYFGGMSVEATAELLAVSAITVKREWGKARAWLYRELDKENPDAA